MRHGHRALVPGLLALGLLLSACGGSAAPASSSSGAKAAGGGQASAPASAPAASSSNGAPTTVRVALASPTYTPWAPMHLAEQKGMFAKYGVKVDITAMNGGGPMQQALVSGTADIIMFLPAGMALAVQKGVKEKIVAVDQLHPDGWEIMVKNGSPYKSFADLAGKDVGISGTGAATDLAVRWAENHYHVKVHEVPLGNGRLPNLIAGHVAAAVITPPDSFGASKDGLRVLVDLAKVMPNTAFDAAVASDSFIAQHPAGVRGFLQGFFAGLAYMRQNKQAAISYLQSYTKDPAALAAQEYQHEILDMPVDGNFTQADIANSINLDTLAGYKVPAVSTLYTKEFVPVKVS